MRTTFKRLLLILTLLTVCAGPLSAAASKDTAVEKQTPPASAAKQTTAPAEKAAPAAEKTAPAPAPAVSADKKPEVPKTTVTEAVPDPFQPLSADIKVIKNRQKEVEKDLDEWGKLPADQTAVRYGISVDLFNTRGQMLSALKDTYTRLDIARTKLEQERKDLKKLQDDRSEPQMLITAKPPFSLEFYDNSLVTVDELNRNLTNAQEDQDHMTDLVNSGVKALETNEAKWRLNRDDYAANPTNTEKRWTLSNSALVVEYFRASLVLGRILLDIQNDTQKTLEINLARAKAVEAWVATKLNLDEDAFQKSLEGIKESISKLNEKLPPLMKQLDEADRAYSALDPALTSQSGNNPKDIPHLNADLKLAERYRLRGAVSTTQEKISLLNEQIQIWTNRFQLRRQGFDKLQAPALLSRIDNRQENLNRDLASVQRELVTLQSRSTSVEKSIAEASGQKNIDILKKIKASIITSVNQQLEYASAVISLQAQYRYLKTELERSYQTVTVTEKFADLWKKKTMAILNTELWKVGNDAIRLKQAMIAMAILVLGVAACRTFTKLVLKRFFNWWGMDQTTTQALQQYSFYILVIICFILALSLVGIPLTAFAFLGGAVAIAIGFGAQNLFNNLISGIMLAINKPFRIGDTVQIGSVTAVVKEIGPRATRLRTFDEYDVIIPNSQLLDNQLTNWSLTDTLARGKVTFGVCYGTPVKKVEQVVLQAVAENRRILRNPEPWVHLSNFSDSSLDFTVYFWVDMRVVGAFKAESDIRFAIIQAFDDNDIQMPFPQMDVHLDQAPPDKPQKLIKVDKLDKPKNIN